MGKYAKLKKEITQNVTTHTDSTISELTKVATESQRVADTIHNVNIILNDIESQFEAATKLKGKDIAFLFTAVALQVARQYLIGLITQRVGDKEAANRTPGHHEEHSDRNHEYYNPSLEKILTNPVPFDTSMGSRDKGLGVGGGFTHRAKTLGHDPILGWIFGTANIATSTCTINNLDILKSLSQSQVISPSNLLATYHIVSGADKVGRIKDAFGNKASLSKTLSCTYHEKLFEEDMEGKQKVGLSVAKEAIHLASDVYTTASLPIPIVSTLSVSLARRLADYGLDTGFMLKVANQALYAQAINTLISMIHSLFYDESYDGTLGQYQVRTHKILMYSNTIASLSNIIAVSIAAAAGIYTGNPKLVKKSLNFLDIGGILVTIHQIVTSREMIYNIKKEYLANQWYQIIMEG